MRYYKGVNLMDTVTKQYIETVKVSDIPWHRLTTTYGRATDFPAHLEVLWDMKNVDAIDAAGEELAQNIEHQSTLWHATPFAMVFLLRIFKKALEADMLNEEYLWSEEYDEDEDILRYEEEEVFPDDLFFSFYYYSLQVLLLGKPLLDEANEEEGKLLELLTEIDH